MRVLRNFHNKATAMHLALELSWVVIKRQLDGQKAVPFTFMLAIKTWAYKTKAYAVSWRQSSLPGGIIYYLATLLPHIHITNHRYHTHHYKVICVVHPLDPNESIKPKSFNGVFVFPHKNTVSFSHHVCSLLFAK